MFFGDGYFGLGGDLRLVGRNSCHLFYRWLKKGSGGRGSEETSGRCGVDGRNDWRGSSSLGASDSRVKG